MTEILITPTDKKVWEIKARIAELGKQQKLICHPETVGAKFIHKATIEFAKQLDEYFDDRIATLQKQLRELK